MTQLTQRPPVLVLEEVVTRWVEHRPGDLGPVLAGIPRTVDLGESQLHFEARFTRTPAYAHPTWIAHGRILPPARLRRRGTRVELSVTAWSDDVAEIDVRRSGRRLLAWTATREHRYYAFAHRAADHVLAVIVGDGMLTG